MWILYAATMMTTLDASSIPLSLQCTGAVNVLAPTAAISGYNVSGIAGERMDQTLVVDFEMADGIARMRVPSQLRPSFSSTKKGWSEVTNLAVSDRIISGDVRLNFMNKTSFEIDRATGIMQSKRGFRAQCEPVDTSKRKF